MEETVYTGVYVSLQFGVPLSLSMEILTRGKERLRGDGSERRVDIGEQYRWMTLFFLALRLR